MIDKSCDQIALMNENRNLKNLTYIVIFTSVIAIGLTIFYLEGQNRKSKDKTVNAPLKE
jgi:hypothetical protein